MRLLVVGASGFIGRNLLASAKPNTNEIVATYNAKLDFPDYVKELGDARIHPEKCDLRSSKEVESLFKRYTDFDKCVYLASDTRVGFLSTNQSIDVTNNILPAANFAQRYRGGQVTFFSSGAVYMGQTGLVSHDSVRPSIPYAISKYAAELYLRHASKRGSYGCNIVRFFGAYGPHEPERKVTRKLLLEINSSNSREIPFTVYGDGRNLIDVMYVEDAVRAILTVVGSKKRDLTVDLCGGFAMTINDYVHAICKTFNRVASIKHEGSSAEYIDFRASGTDFRKIFGFKPEITLEVGLKKYMTFLKSEVPSARSK